MKIAAMMPTPRAMRDVVRTARIPVEVRVAAAACASVRMRRTLLTDRELPCDTTPAAATAGG